VRRREDGRRRCSGRRAAARELQRNGRGAEVQRYGGEGGDVGVVRAQQVETGSDAAGHAADGIGGVAPAQPGRAARVGA
jgi:hypothetical protein